MKADETTRAITCTNVCKHFALFDNPVRDPVLDALGRIFFNGLRPKVKRQRVALDNVNLRLERGETLGLIGPNGSGKTTLLKIIAGLILPESGVVEVNGRVSALFQQGVAINPNMSGHDNIFHSCIMMGMSSHETRELVPEIIAFAELGEYIDRPYRTYSSGMKARLLFAIATGWSPDIMIVDEGLSAGDAAFARKCRARIREICDSGTTTLFVSHNIGQLRGICDRAMFIADGQVRHDGNVDETISMYNDWIFTKEATAAAPTEKTIVPTARSTNDVRITSVALFGDDNSGSTSFRTGSPFAIEVSYECEPPSDRQVSLFIGFLDALNDQFVGEINTSYLLNEQSGDEETSSIMLKSTGKLRVSTERLLLVNNHYSLWIMIYDQHDTLSEIRGVAPFFVARKHQVTDRGVVFAQPAIVTHVD